jgi:transposase
MAPQPIGIAQNGLGNDGVDGPAQTASSAKAAAFRAATGGPSMDKLSRIGVDLGKGYFQVHCLPLEGGPAMNRKLSRPKMRAFFAGIAPCRVGMEACGSAHYWARELVAMGHEVVLMPPAYIKPYVKRGKNDAVDAAAICEAMSRPDMRFVPIKSADQQAVLMVHKTRELLVKQRTMSVNALRSHLAEFGLVVAKGIGRVDELSELAENDASLPQEAREAAKLLALHIEALTRSIDAMERKIAKASASSKTCRLLDRVPGVGPLTASAIAASVPDPSVFKSGRDFAAWLGLTPRQNSSGGKAKLGAVTKQGNRYIRKLLVVGSTAVLRFARKRRGPLADSIAALRARKPERLVAVALANKLARICWAIMSTGELFRQEAFAKA